MRVRAAWKGFTLVALMNKYADERPLANIRRELGESLTESFDSIAWFNTKNFYIIGMKRDFDVGTAQLNGLIDVTPGELPRDKRGIGGEETSMTTATAEVTERENLMRVIERLSDRAILQVRGYAERVHEEEIEELEEQEDIAYIDALPREEYENAVPEEVIITDYKAKYGTLD
jgi:hypothetical protein